MTVVCNLVCARILTATIHTQIADSDYDVVSLCGSVLNKSVTK